MPGNGPSLSASCNAHGVPRIFQETLAICMEVEVSIEVAGGHLLALTDDD